MRLSGRTNYLSELFETGRDFVGSWKRISLASNLAFQDILSRYRGSILGPWWITLMTASLVLGIGVNYSALLHQKINGFLPYVAIGMVTWGFVSGGINEGADAFVSGGAMIKQSSLPLPLFILRCLIRNGINLAHQVVIIVVVLAWFKVFPGIGILWALPGLVLLVINLGWIGLLLAMVCARFRDMPQIVTAVLQVVFFLSPIFWVPTPELMHNPFVAANPFYFAIESVREPLLKGEAPKAALNYLSTIAGFGWLITILIYNQTRRRVVHYL
jgi:ABC-type polysaccharide/polyol phosphate export permease